MPTKRPRMALSLPPEVHKALMDLSAVSGVAAASFASQLLSESLPMIIQLTKVFQAGKDNPNLAAEELETLITKAIIQTQQTSMDFQENIKPKLRKSPKKKNLESD